MQRLVRPIFLLLVMSTSLHGQQATPLTLVVEPGLLTAAAVSAIDATPLTAFYIRAQLMTRSDSARWRGVLGASATPFGFRGAGVRNQNAPVLFGGVQLDVIPKRITGGWFGAYVPLLITYSHRGGSSENTRLYGADIAAEGTVVIFLGSKLFADLGAPWSRIGGYVTIFQNLTPNSDPTFGTRDRFRPDFMYGVSIPLAGSR